DVAHARVHPDQALAERRLARARLAREPHDLAVRDLERRAVDRLHVAAQRAVVDGQVVDGEAHFTLSLGLKTSSSPTFITYSPPTSRMIPTPGGTNHHHEPSSRALARNALFIIRPSDTCVDGPRPRKSSEAPIRIAPPNSRMNIISRYELMFGAISLVMICRVFRPVRRAMSTKSRVLSVKVCARTARAAHGHEGSPI